MKPARLYVIAEKRQASEHGVVISLRKACERMGVDCELIITGETVLADIAGMQFEKGSLLYRVNTSAKAAIIESMLVRLHPGTFTTIYRPKTLPVPGRSFRELCEQIAQGLRGIPTLIIDETWQRMDTEVLQKRVAELGDFPIVVKTLGLSHGQGVKKIDDVHALQALLEQLSFEEYGTIARKYLADYRHFRLIVLDGEVAAAIEYHKPPDDFRTNASEEPDVSAVAVEDLPADLVLLAKDSVALRASILGGVDILVDQTDGVGYLAEVNVPCYYPRAESPTGIDISGQLLTAMLRKRVAERG